MPLRSMSLKNTWIWPSYLEAGETPCVKPTFTAHAMQTAQERSTLLAGASFVGADCSIAAAQGVGIADLVMASIEPPPSIGVVHVGPIPPRETPKATMNDAILRLTMPVTL